MIQGRDITLSVDGKTIAAAKSCTLDIQQDFIQTCSPTSGRWKQYIPTTIGWSASVDMLVVDMANPKAWLTEMKSSQTELTMRFYDSEMGIYQVGSVWIESWRVGASVGSLATFALQLKGTGELSNAADDDYPVLIGDTLYTNWNFDASDEQSMKNTGCEVDSDENFVKHTTE